MTPNSILRKATIEKLDSIKDEERKKAFKSIYSEGSESEYYEEYWEDYCEFMDELTDTVMSQYDDYCNRK